MNKNFQKLISGHGISQEKLADILGISRPTVAKIISGEREIQMSEAKALAKTLGVTVAEVFGEEISREVILEKKVKKNKEEIRISVPAENVEKFKNALLYITQKIGALPNVGQTVLYKILYFCDFDYYEKFEEQLIGARYIKNHYGPTPIEFKVIVREMIKDGQIEEIETKYFDKDQKKYIPIISPDLSIFSGQELEHINEEIERLGNKTATELSNYSHKDVPWIVTPTGEEIDYENVFYRTSETSVRTYEDDTV